MLQCNTFATHVHHTESPVRVPLQLSIAVLVWQNINAKLYQL